MSERPHILITNDDGVSAPGIKHLWDSLKNVADLTVVAPLKEQSAVGLSLTTRDPLSVEKINWDGAEEVYGVSGTPADCVKLALSVLLEKPPALVVSGVNRGANSGRNILYSGTVAGAIESVIHGVPAIAFSCYDFDEPDYMGTKESILKIVSYLLTHSLPLDTLLNVNFPAKSHGDYKGIKMTRHGRQFWGESPDKRFHPVQGHAYYWLGAKLVQFDEEEDCDISWLNKGYVTAVPVQICQLTHQQHLDAHREHFDDFMA